jgi:GAF domain-containing protein
LPELVSPRLGASADDDNVVTAALRSQRAAICNNLMNDAVDLRGHDILVAAGFRGLGIFPLVIAGKTTGCLVLLTDEIGQFDAAETRLLMELAGNISFALDHIDKAERLKGLA